MATDQVTMRFWLMQRLGAADRDAAGFDGLFRLDYMGSSEYEWGAPTESLRRMRGGDLVIGEAVLNHGVDHLVHVVCRPNLVAAVGEGLRCWAAKGFQCKEQSRFDRALSGSWRSDYDKVDAWWSLGDDVMLALDRPMADRLLEAITRP